MAVVVATGNEISTEAESPLLDSRVVAGSIDIKGRPAIRSKFGCWKSAFYILVAEMAERSAYYGVRSNLVSYLSGPMGQSTATAVVNVNAWTGVSDLSPLLGAFVADAYLGRYKAIVIASVFYVLGLGCLSLSAALRSSSYSNCMNGATCASSRMCSPSILDNILFFSSVYLVALMQGAHRPCLQAFGADQFNDQDHKEQKAKAAFFNWWNFSLAMGTLSAYSVLNYIDENLSWQLGLGIQTVIMLFGLIIFLLGTGSYRLHANGGENNPFVRVGSVFVKGVRNWWDASTKETISEINTDDIEDAKSILNIIPIWITCLGFTTVTAQPTTIFTKQGATMERHITSTLQIPAASLQSLVTVTMLILLPTYDLIFVPIARSITKNPLGLTTLQRSGTGLFMSIISMIIAGLIERKRLATAVEYGLVDTPNATIPMSISWLIPQYIVLGSSYVFALVGLQEFFYDQVPSELKSFGLALYLSAFGIGNFISSFLVYGIQKATMGDGKEGWFSDNLNRAHLDYFYWLLAGLSTMALVAFVYFAKSYVYARKAHV